MVEVGAQAFHAGQSIADGRRERGFSRDRSELHGQPDLEVIEDRGSVGLSQFGAAVRRGPSGLFLDSVELRDPADGLLNDRQPGSLTGSSTA